MTITEIAALLRERFGDKVLDVADTPMHGHVRLAPGVLVAASEFLRDDERTAFEQLHDLTAVDWIDHFEVVIHLFSIGSTCALTTVEFEPGLIKHDIRNVLQKLVPDDARYEHEATWNDDNGHSHVRAALIGPSLTVPFSNGKLLTGEYQQVVFLDFDTRPRRRKVVGTVII